MKFILGTKIGMTQVFRPDGTVVPVTRVQAGPCVITQVKTKEKDGVSAVQVGYKEQRSFRLTKALQGHLKGLASLSTLRDVSVTDGQVFERGDQFTVSVFAPGDVVEVVGTSKGRGFQGVVKRHGFRGGPATHGHKDNLRMPGSIGAGGVQRVFKDMRMAGHMGVDQVTVKNLEVVEVHPETNEVYIKGAVPGARGGLLMILSREGTMEVAKSAAPVETAQNQSNEPSAA